MYLSVKNGANQFLQKIIKKIVNTEKYYWKGEDFAEVSKNVLDTNLKIILLDHQNSYKIIKIISKDNKIII